MSWQEKIYNIRATFDLLFTSNKILELLELVQSNAPIIAVDIVMSRLRMHRYLSESFVIEIYIFIALPTAHRQRLNM